MRGSRTAGITTALSSFIAQAILIVSGVLVARLLPVDERGQLALIGLIPIILCQLGGLGLPLAATYALARSPASASAVAEVLTRVMPVQALVLTLAHAGLLTLLFSDDGATVWTAALITVPVFPALLYQQVGLGILQGQQRFTAFNVHRLLPAAGYAGVLVLVAVIGSADLITCAFGWMAAWLLAGIITTRTALRSLRRTPGDAAVERKAFFRFGRRGVMGAVFPVEAFQIDQLIVGVLLAPASLGLYVVAVALTNLPRFVAQSVGMVAYPRIAAESDRAAGLRALWRYCALALVLSAPIVVALELMVGWLIPFFFGEDYRDAVPIARVLLIGALFQSARRVLADAARGLAHPEIGTAAEVASWFVLVPAVFVLEPHGLEGIAAAMVVTYAISLCVVLAGIVTRGGRSPRRPPPAPPDSITPEVTRSSAGEVAG